MITILKNHLEIKKSGDKFANSNTQMRTVFVKPLWFAHSIYSFTFHLTDSLTHRHRGFPHLACVYAFPHCCHHGRCLHCCVSSIVPKAVPLYRPSFLSLSISPRAATPSLLICAESQNGTDTTSAHYNFDLFTISADSDDVRTAHFAANYDTSVAICEFPFSTISSKITKGIGET
ncbi:hypothetical protein GLYMA_05G163500v4 [Glycine max]|nr:hypothetical protein GLYMA_05G163500v4 [Glycine max]KAH1134733.1 hypothetical protein GYH30_012861 [Glycine max]